MKGFGGIPDSQQGIGCKAPRRPDKPPLGGEIIPDGGSGN